MVCPGEESILYVWFQLEMLQQHVEVLKCKWEKKSVIKLQRKPSFLTAVQNLQGTAKYFLQNSECTCKGGTVC